MTEHRLTEVWQERPGEVSYRCSCGLVSKHMEFGPIPICPDDANYHRERLAVAWRTIDKVKAIAERAASAGWRDTQTLTVAEAEGRNAVGEEILRVIESPEAP